MLYLFVDFGFETYNIHTEQKIGAAIMLKPMRWMIIPSMLSFSTLAFAGGVPTDCLLERTRPERRKLAQQRPRPRPQKRQKPNQWQRKRLQRKLPKLQTKSKKVQQAQANSEVRSPAVFGVEDEKLVIDSSQ